MRARPFSAMSLLLLITLISLSLYQGVTAALFLLFPAAPTSKSEFLVEVKKGQVPTELVHLLAEKGVVSDAKRFYWYGRITGQWKHLKTGEYRVTPSMNPREILGTLTSGISVTFPIVIHEGDNLYQVAEQIRSRGLGNEAAFIKLCQNQTFISKLGLVPPPPSLEGYLFPDTYLFSRLTTDEEKIRQMVRRFTAVWGQKQELQAKQMGLTRQQVITLASIVEKETGAPNERPMVSSIFHNRLKKRMRLQSDPTTIYGMWYRYKGKIHKSDLLENTPYNTYKISGLPAGPISNPGLEAIEATLNPAQSEYFYFVSHNDGTHAFSKTFGEHQQAVTRFQLDPKAREGKSWRDLSRSQNKTASRPVK